MVFYTEKLGFSIDFVFNEPSLDGYTALHRDEAFINFREGTPPVQPGSFGGISIEVEDVDVFYQELITRKALPPDFPRQFPHIREHAPEDKAYGVRDMFLVDLNRYIVTVLTPR